MSSGRLVAPPLPWNLELSSNPTVKADRFCIGLGDELTPDQVLGYATGLQLHHICQRHGYAFDKEQASAQLLIQDPDNFREFPVASVFTPANLSQKSERSLLIFDETFSASRQKRPMLDSLIKLMESKQLSQTIVDDAVLVADEMFTNAVYNAPFVDIKTQVNPGINRNTVEVQYNDNKLARLFLAKDETRLMIGVEDPFGSLNLERWLIKIRETYLRGPAATMNLGPGGAGLGSYIIFNAGSSLYFGVWPGQVTVLCCVLPLGISNRKRIELPKHLHWIQR